MCESLGQSKSLVSVRGGDRNKTELCIHERRGEPCKLKAEKHR